MAIHVVCVPMILYTSLLLGSKLTLDKSGYLNLSVLTAVYYAIYYIALDVQFGLLATPILGLMVTTATKLEREYTGPATKIATGLFVFSWLAQFYGHRFYEHKAPALLDNLSQALVLAPFFVMFEIASFLGFRQGILKKVDERIKAESAAKYKKN